MDNDYRTVTRYGVYKHGAFLRSFSNERDAVNWIFHQREDSPAFLTVKPIVYATHFPELLEVTDVR